MLLNSRTLWDVGVRFQELPTIIQRLPKAIRRILVEALSKRRQHWPVVSYQSNAVLDSSMESGYVAESNERLERRGRMAGYRQRVYGRSRFGEAILP